MHNRVYAGNLARRVADFMSFYDKRWAWQLEEARDLAIAYLDRFDVRPTPVVFHESFFVYEGSGLFGLWVI